MNNPELLEGILLKKATTLMFHPQPVGVQAAGLEVPAPGSDLRPLPRPSRLVGWGRRTSFRLRDAQTDKSRRVVTDTPYYDCEYSMFFVDTEKSVSLVPQITKTASFATTLKKVIIFGKHDH